MNVLEKDTNHVRNKHEWWHIWERTNENSAGESRKKWLSKELCFLIITEEGENKEASVSRPWEEDLSWAAEIIKQKDDVMLPYFTVWISEEILNQWSFKRAVEEEYAKPMSNTSSLKTLADRKSMEKGCPLVCAWGAAWICIYAICIINCNCKIYDNSNRSSSFRPLI